VPHNAATGRRYTGANLLWLMPAIENEKSDGLQRGVINAKAAEIQR